jgi:hypothetical protein
MIRSRAVEEALQWPAGDGLASSAVSGRGKESEEAKGRLDQWPAGWALIDDCKWVYGNLHCPCLNSTFINSHSNFASTLSNQQCS